MYHLKQEKQGICKTTFRVHFALSFCAALGKKCEKAFLSVGQRTLDQLVEHCTWHLAGQSSNPHGGGGGAVYLRVEKKSPYLSHVQSIVGFVLSHGYRITMYRWGRSSGGFLDMCEKVFFLVQCHGGGLPPLVKFFFFLSVHFP